MQVSVRNITDVPVDRRAFVIPQGRKYRYAGEYLHHLHDRVTQHF